MRSVGCQFYTSPIISLDRFPAWMTAAAVPRPLFPLLLLLPRPSGMLLSPRIADLCDARMLHGYRGYNDEEIILKNMFTTIVEHRPLRTTPEFCKSAILICDVLEMKICLLISRHNIAQVMKLHLQHCISISASPLSSLQSSCLLSQASPSCGECCLRYHNDCYI